MRRADARACRDLYDPAMPADYKPSPEWVTGVNCDLNPAVPVKRRDGSPALRHDRPYLSGKVWAIDGNGRKAGYQSYDVYPELRIVLLDSAGMGMNDGDNGKDNRYQGGARAMLDELDRRYPEPEWWMASSNGALHTQEGVDLMRGRRRDGRRKVHTEDCALARPKGCKCDFTDRPEDAV